MNKSGYVAIVGWPNAGKSTLMNKLLGYKLSIVSSKPQTTRESIVGILNEPDVQMIMLDTPGWINAQDLLQSSMRKAIFRSIYDDADLLLWVIDVHAWTEEELEWADLLQKTGKPWIAAVNKIDKPEDQARCTLIQDKIRLRFQEAPPILAVSAKQGVGVQELKKILISRLPESPAYFPLDQLTPHFERFFVVELIRERIMEMFHDEVPHASAVVLEEFREKASQKDLISATIYVETEGQKKIVIGHHGFKIKELGTNARKEIETNLGRPVFLELRVKVKKNWRKDAQFVASLTPS